MKFMFLMLISHAFSYDISFVAGGKAYSHIKDGELIGIGPSAYLKDNNLKFYYPFLPLSVGNNMTALQFPWVFAIHKYENMTCYHVVSSTLTSCVPNE